MNVKKISAVVLAGGKSSRMGCPKPLLKIGDKTFFQIISEKILKAGIKNIYLVLGADSEYIKSNLNTENMAIIINNSWKKGQLSSLQAAIRNVKNDTEGIMMFLIDHPEVKVLTIKKLIKAFEAENADVVVPEYNGRGGHPVIFSSSVFKALLDAPLNEGARAVVRNKNYIKRRIIVNDSCILQDIDTMDEFRGIK